MQPPVHLADRFAEADRRIADSIRAYDTARDARDHAKAPRSYARANDALQRACDEHTAAHAARAALCDEWSAYFAATYGRGA